MAKIFDITKLRLNPDNPFPFKGDEVEWRDFVSKIERDPEFLDMRPIVYDSSNDNLVIAGNKRLKALIELEIRGIPENRVKDCRDWSPEKKRRFEIADNWHPNGSDWELENVTEDEAIEWGIEFGEEEDTHGSKEEPEDKMTISLNYVEDEYRQVKDALASIGKTPEAAVWGLLIQKRLVQDV